MFVCVELRGKGEGKDDENSSGGKMKVYLENVIFLVPFWRKLINGN